jgi:hypothetical protein
MRPDQEKVHSKQLLDKTKSRREAMKPGEFVSRAIFDSAASVPNVNSALCRKWQFENAINQSQIKMR